MRRSLLLALASVGVVVASLPASSAPESFPRGEVVVRPECFGSLEVEASKSSGYGGGLGGILGGSGSRSRPSSAPPPSAPAPIYDDAMDEAEMAPVAASAPGRTRKNKDRRSSNKPKKSSAKAPAAEAPPPPPPPAELAFDLDGSAVVEETKEEAVRDRMREEVDEVRRPGRSLDWGATVYLSNDDSMSLASAQRLLFATMNGLGFSPREVRPHELLNYFSFDTVTPEPDQVFDVLASAEHKGDGLSVAFAVKGAVPDRQPLDLTLLVDRSCSMQAEGRMDYTRRGLSLMADQLERGDRLDLVLFDDGVCVPLQNYVVGRDDPRLLTDALRRMEPLGSTDLDLGLREAYDVAKAHVDTHGRNRRVMVLTDALLNTGDVNPNTVSEIGKSFEGDQIRITGIGVGREFNDQVLDMLTEKGKGAYVYLGSEAVVDRVFGAQGFDSLVQTIAHDVQFALHLPDSLAMERFYGEEASTIKEDVQPLNYYAGTSQLFLQDLRIRGRAPERSAPVQLEITYRDARTGEPQRRTFRTTVGKMLDSDPHNVRKGLTLMAWTDMLMAEAMGADSCGSELKAYASRAAGVADDAEIAFVNGLVQRRCGDFDLPEPRPRGDLVSYKVRVDADIPIAEVALTCEGERWSESLSGSDTIARFQAFPGSCDLILTGAVDMVATVEVPSTGGDTRCIVRGGRLSCS
ncbi:MAG: VWA domain-containing protein [Myxococcales bacterium]|nr:VWA domain-containing protein [Myxococcales bacterium]